MQRPDPLIPSKPGAQDRVAMNNRVKWLEELYFLDGRDKPDHPQRGLFIGLAETYANLESTDGF